MLEGKMCSVFNFGTLRITIHSHKNKIKIENLKIRFEEKNRDSSYKHGRLYL